MGSSSSKGKRAAEAAKYGQIYTRTDKPTYFGGETVSGQIFLNIVQPFPGRKLLLRLKGVEIVHLVRREQVGKNTYENHYKDRTDVIDLVVPIYTWDSVLPGHYTIPFAFLLPANLPSTFHQEGHRYLANLSYRLEAILEPDDLKLHPKLKHKENLIVKRPIVHATGENICNITTKVSTCCCCEQGSNSLAVKFEKNWYSPGEIAHVIASLDNSLCKINNTNLSFTLRQRIRLYCRGHTHQKEFIKVESRQPGAPFGQATESKALELTLPPFQEGDYRSAKRDNIKSHLLFLAENNMFLHSATNGKLISSEYVLEVTCPMDGCCSTTPTAILPIEIYHPEVIAPVVVAPADWNPTQLDHVNVSFAPPVDMNQAPMQTNVGINLGYNNNMNAPRTDVEQASQYQPPPQFNNVNSDQYAKPQYGANYFS